MPRSLSTWADAHTGKAGCLTRELGEEAGVQSPTGCCPLSSEPAVFSGRPAPVPMRYQPHPSVHLPLHAISLSADTELAGHFGRERRNRWFNGRLLRRSTWHFLSQQFEIVSNEAKWNSSSRYLFCPLRENGAAPPEGRQAESANPGGKLAPPRCPLPAGHRHGCCHTVGGTAKFCLSAVTKQTSQGEKGGCLPAAFTDASRATAAQHAHWLHFHVCPHKGAQALTHPAPLRGSCAAPSTDLLLRPPGGVAFLVAAPPWALQI
ncbi:hypothetical protein CB1_000294023 [Camelus ferus]|nr:hypothetical protein CB1_000294023 [Camelus ferus]